MAWARQLKKGLHRTLDNGESFWVKLLLAQLMSLPKEEMTRIVESNTAISFMDNDYRSNADRH
jgi:hypothetical protein